MPHPLKHTVVSRKLLEEIASGKYNTDRRLPSEAELVGRFKLSRPTISRALRDLEASGVIVRRPGSGTYLKDEMLTDARASIKRLDLIFPDLPQVEIFEEIGGALAGLARVQGFQMP
jgi:DNA-binding GntR family transcriptional regulator